MHGVSCLHSSLKESFLLWVLVKRQVKLTNIFCFWFDDVAQSFKDEYRCHHITFAIVVKSLHTYLHELFTLCLSTSTKARPHKDLRKISL